MEALWRATARRHQALGILKGMPRRPLLSPGFDNWHVLDAAPESLTEGKLGHFTWEVIFVHIQVSCYEHVNPRHLRK